MVDSCMSERATIYSKARIEDYVILAKREKRREAVVLKGDRGRAEHLRRNCAADDFRQGCIGGLATIRRHRTEKGL